MREKELPVVRDGGREKISVVPPSRLISPEKTVKMRVWFSNNRMILFYSALFISPLLSVISTQGFFNLFFYSLLVFVIVYQDEDRYRKIPIPEIDEMAVGLLVCAGSFVFDLATRGIFGGGYGQTDYVIFVLGVILFFFGYRHIREVAVPIVLVVGLAGALKGLQLVYEHFFETVADWFVDVVVWITGPGGMGYPVYKGALPYGIPPQYVSPSGLVEEAGALTVFGLNENSTLVIAWGCTGLRSLLMFAFILSALIIPLPIPGRRKALWMAIGVSGAFLINLLRMVMLVLIMYYRDSATMMWVHTHLGDFLFVVWVAVFWSLFVHFEKLKD